MCHQDVSWLMFKLHQIKGYFSFSIDMSPKGRISVIFNSFELLELPGLFRLRVPGGLLGVETIDGRGQQMAPSVLCLPPG